MLLREDCNQKYKKISIILSSLVILVFSQGDKLLFIIINKKIVVMGILHPDILTNFKWPYPVSCLEINLEIIY